MTIEMPPLDPGEALIWSGRPFAMSYALRMSAGRFLFGLLFFGFSVFWLVGAAQTDRGQMPLGVPFWMFGLPFVIVGAGMVLSPFWHLWRGMHTWYVLTNARAMVNISGPFARRLSMPLGQITFVDVRPGSNGSGSIYFKETASQSNKGGTQINREGFVAVPEVDRVEQLLRQTMEKAATTAARRAAL